MVLDVHVNENVKVVKTVLVECFEGQLLEERGAVLKVALNNTAEPAKVKSQILAINGVTRLDWIA
jgi:hypothetical protein